MDLSQELAIARSTICDSKLTDCIDTSKLVCEIYCYNAIHSPTLFAQIYCHNDLYSFIYARTVLVDFWGSKSISQTFENTQKASLHSAKSGNIVCGMKLLQPDDSHLCDIISVLPNKTDHSKHSGVALDGQFTYIKSYAGEAPAELSFFDVSDIKSTPLSDSQVKVLENMTSLLGEITK